MSDRDVDKSIREIFPEWKELLECLVVKYAEHANTRIAPLVKVNEVMRDCLVDVRSELTHSKSLIDERWCIDEICRAIAECERIMKESEGK